VQEVAEGIHRNQVGHHRAAAVARIVHMVHIQQASQEACRQGRGRAGRLEHLQVNRED
jgi:hypothetical protein